MLEKLATDVLIILDIYAAAGAVVDFSESKCKGKTDILAAGGYSNLSSCSTIRINDGADTAWTFSRVLLEELESRCGTTFTAANLNFSMLLSIIHHN